MGRLSCDTVSLAALESTKAVRTLSKYLNFYVETMVRLGGTHLTRAWRCWRPFYLESGAWLLLWQGTEKKCVVSHTIIIFSLSASLNLARESWRCLGLVSGELVRLSRWIAKYQGIKGHVLSE